VEHHPKKFITRLLEFAAISALSAFLIRLAVRYVLDIWPALLIMVIVTAGGVIGYRAWKGRGKW
jgi:hypothetical protein